MARFISRLMYPPGARGRARPTGGGRVGRASPGSRPQALRRFQGRRGAGGARHAARSAAPEPGRPHLPGEHQGGARAVVHEPGPQPHLRLQPRRGKARLRRGGAARPDAGHGVLGPGPGARTEHQRRHGARGRAGGVRTRAEGGGAQGPRHAARARVHRRAGQALHRQARRSGRGRPRLCRRHARRDPRLSRRPRCPHAARRGVDGPAPVELLDARRPAVRRDAAGAGHAREGADRPQEPSRARSTSGFTSGNPPTRPSGPRRKPIACCR